MRKQMIVGYFGIELTDDTDGNTPAGLIGEKQQATLVEYIESTGTDREKFERVWGPIGEMQEPNYRPALAILKSRERRQAR